MQQTDKSPLSKHRETQRKKAGRRRMEEEHRERRSSQVGLNKAWAALFQSVLKQQGEDDTPAYTSQWHAPKFKKGRKIVLTGQIFYSVWSCHSQDGRNGNKSDNLNIRKKRRKQTHVRRLTNKTTTYRDAGAPSITKVCWHQWLSQTEI